MIIPFNNADRARYYELLDEVFDSGFLSGGRMLDRFEELFSSSVGLPAAAVANGGAGLLALYEYADVRGGEVIVPANTFWATALAAKRAGADVVYADCNREDLCLSLADLKKKVTDRTKAITLVHIGGHIAFEADAIADFCRERNIALIEDCAHAHGATWNGRSAGSWGIGGSYSFYATKTLPMGEGGIVVSKDAELVEWLRYYRNYGKEVSNGVVSYPQKEAFNFRMNEVTAALGVVQMERLPRILSWKRNLAAKLDRIFDRRVHFPDGMESGYYKYIVFDYPLTEATGQVFSATDFGNEIEGMPAELPNSYWVAEHHKCAPIWHGWPHADESVEQLRERLLG